jgi:hypothetical protein
MGGLGVLDFGQERFEDVRKRWKKRENNEIKQQQTQSGFVMKFLFIIMKTSSVFG